MAFLVQVDRKMLRADRE